MVYKRTTAAILAACILILGGVNNGEKGEIPTTEEGTIHKEGKGNTAAYGSNDRTYTGLTGSQELSGGLQSSPGSYPLTTRHILQVITEPKAQAETVSRGADSRKPINTYVSLGTFKITAYTAGPESTGKGPDHPLYGHVAISGSKRADFQPVLVKEGYTIAADWKVLPPGTRVWIEGVGERVVEDRGGAVKGNHIDLYIPDLKEALDWGVRQREVFVIEWGR